MSVENHVVSLETAKRMKELGLPQGKAMFYWVCTDGFPVQPFLVRDNDDSAYRDATPVDALVATEILEELPGNIVIDEGSPENECTYWINIGKQLDEYGASYDYYDVTAFSVYHANPTEALALLWCELKEKGII